MTVRDAAAALSRALHRPANEKGLDLDAHDRLADLDAALCTEGAERCACGHGTDEHCEEDCCGGSCRNAHCDCPTWRAPSQDENPDKPAPSPDARENGDGTPGADRGTDK